MDPHTAAERLAAVDRAPALNRGARLREMVLGLVAAAALFSLLYVPAELDAGQGVRTGAAVSAVLLVLWWIWYHSERPRRRPQSRVEQVFRVLSISLMGGAVANLIWGGPDSTIGILVPAAVPAACLLVFLALRWRA